MKRATVEYGGSATAEDGEGEKTELRIPPKGTAATFKRKARGPPDLRPGNEVDSGSFGRRKTDKGGGRGAMDKYGGSEPAEGSGEETAGSWTPSEGTAATFTLKDRGPLAQRTGTEAKPGQTTRTRKRDEEEGQGAVPATLGTWRVPVFVSTEELEQRWNRLLPRSEVACTTDEWPHAVVARGDEVMNALNGTARTPEVVVVDGGCIHASTGTALRARHLRLWGRVRLGECTAWMLRERHGKDVEVFESREALAEALDTSMQRRMRKAYDGMGGQRFRWDVRQEDFEWGAATRTLAVQEVEEWGDLWTQREARGARFWDWPMEPDTEEIPWSSPEITGLEVEETLTPPQAKERKDDLDAWKAEGQTWWGAFLEPARKRLKVYIDGNHRVNMAVATAAAEASEGGAKVPKFGDVFEDGENEIIIPQDDLRPGARGKLWSWESGRCEETKPQSVAADIAEAGGFVAKKVLEIARLLKFPDKRATQMLTETGATHGTKKFPLTSYAGRNHQGASTHHAIVTKMIQGNVKDAHFTMATGDEGPGKERPNTVPFAVVPIGGTVQRQKDEERYILERDGGDVDMNVRGRTEPSAAPQTGRFRS